MENTNSFEPFLTKGKEIDFFEHLNRKTNIRILVSGRFGSGKTTFLKDFFDKKTSFFKVVHLFPVNYSIASNKDIFELLKTDISIKILDNHSEYIASKFEGKSKLKRILQTIKKNPKELISLAELIPQIGGKVKSVLSVFSKLNDKFNEKDESDDIADILLAGIENAGNTKGLLYHEDLQTRVISTLLTELSSENENISSVLVLDDLDRLDPEHIFRILNVFSAHFEDPFSTDGFKNKFGFDKVVIVADIDNLRSIFEHKYGVRTDFNGYIDKFYSEKVFQYSLKNYIIDNFNSVMASTMVLEPNNHYLKLSEHWSNPLLFFNIIIEHLIDNDKLSIRQFKRFNGLTIDSRFTDKVFKNTALKGLQGAFWIYALSLLLGSMDDIVKAIFGTKWTNLERANDYILGNVIQISRIKIDGFDLNSNAEQNIQVMGNDGNLMSVGIKLDLNSAKLANSSYVGRIDFGYELIKAVENLKTMI